jgi:hypothetical protein
MAPAPDTHILLRSPVTGGNYALAEHLGQPDDYTAPDGVVWQNSGAWARYGNNDFRVYDVRPQRPLDSN